MTSKIKIKIKEVKEGCLTSSIDCVGDPDAIINGLLDALYKMCRNHNVVLEDVANTFLNFDKQYSEE